MKIKTWKIVLLSIIMFLVVPVSLYLIVCTPNPWGLGFIKPEDTGTWLGFYGSVLGGLLTFGGVWWTINDNHKQRVEELILQYRPIILFKRKNDITEKTVPNLQILSKKEKCMIVVFLHNIGRGEAHHLKFTINNACVEYDILASNGFIIASIDIPKSIICQNPNTIIQVKCLYQSLLLNDGEYCSCAELVYSLSASGDKYSEFELTNIKNFKYAVPQPTHSKKHI